nr:hypothetical protein [uncultured Desulfuromonas sp.]
MRAAVRRHYHLPRLQQLFALLAVFYLTIGVHLLHPLFHDSHSHETETALCYHHSEEHHHAPCPLHDYCQTIHHLDLSVHPEIAFLRCVEQQAILYANQPVLPNHATGCPVRAPPAYNQHFSIPC